MPVAESFFAAERLADDCIWMTGNGKFNIDLWLFNRHVLVKAGVKEENITTTMCAPAAIRRHCGPTDIPENSAEAWRR